MEAEISFKRSHFQNTIILSAVRWYLSYSLSYRDIEELMLERGVNVDHSTLNRCVIHYSPLLEAKFRAKFKQEAGASWRMDETYIKIKGESHYLYRAVDKDDNTVDFMLSKKRDESAAKAFFFKAIGSNGLPEKVTIDKNGANHAALNNINAVIPALIAVGLTLIQIQIRQIKYLNNIIEQDHCGIKRITNPMMGFKSFNSASATLSGIELYRMLKKGQHIEPENSPAFEQFYSLAA